MLRTTALSFALLTSLFSTFSVQSASSDTRSKDFIIQNDDGYGTSDCLAKGSACGKIVADAWCESKGFGKSVAYRAVDPSDVTNSINTRRSSVDAFLISCTE
jgi:hypothetical protein